MIWPWIITGEGGAATGYSASVRSRQAEELVDGRVAVAVRQQLHPLPGGADEGRLHLGIGHGAVAAVAVHIVLPQPGGTPLG